MEKIQRMETGTLVWIALVYILEMRFMKWELSWAFHEETDLRTVFTETTRSKKHLLVQIFMWAMPGAGILYYLLSLVVSMAREFFNFWKNLPDE